VLYFALNDIIYFTFAVDTFLHDAVAALGRPFSSSCFSQDIYVQKFNVGSEYKYPADSFTCDEADV